MFINPVKTFRKSNGILEKSSKPYGEHNLRKLCLITSKIDKENIAYLQKTCREEASTCKSEVCSKDQRFFSKFGFPVSSVTRSNNKPNSACDWIMQYFVRTSETSENVPKTLHSHPRTDLLT